MNVLIERFRSCFKCDNVNVIENEEQSSSLPDEIYFHIFQYLDLTSLKSARLVCHHWKWLVRQSRHLTKSRVTLNIINMEDVLKSEIVQDVEELKYDRDYLFDTRVIRTLIYYVRWMSPSKLKCLDLTCSLPVNNGAWIKELKYAYIDHEDLIELFSLLPVVKISHQKFKDGAEEEIFSHILNSNNLRLKCLHFHFNCLPRSKVNPETFSAGASKLSEIKLSFLSRELCQALFEYIIHSTDIQLVKMGIESKFLEKLDPKLMARAVCKLKSVSLRNSYLREQHLIAILMKISNCEEDVKLEHLDISHTIKLFRCEVDQDLFSSAAVNLVSLKADCNSGQTVSILDKIYESNSSKLENLALLTPVPREGYPLEKLAVVESKLKFLALRSCTTLSFVLPDHIDNLTF